MQGLHNLELDPSRPPLYDFFTEIRSLLAVPRGSRPWRLRMTRFFSRPGTGRDAALTLVYFGCSQSLFAAVNKPKKSATSDASMVSRGFPVIVTGYSHSIDVVVRRGLYLRARGGTHSFRYQVEFCSKERGDEKTSNTHTIVVPCFRNCFCRYAEGCRCSAFQGSAGQTQSGQKG